MAVWRPRLEAVALAAVAARSIGFGADVANAVSWGRGSVGDWLVGLSGYPMVLPGLMLLVPLVILVVTRIQYSWPKDTPATAAVPAAVGAWILGAAGVVSCAGGLVTQLARMGDAEAYGATGPAFVAGAFYALAGLVVYAAAATLAMWLLREMRPARPARILPEPESDPRPQG
jgi:hypothetical protein